LTCILIIFLLSTATGACSAQGDETTTIADLIVNNESFTVFAAALNNSSLINVLSGEDPHTVFVPTDEAFNNTSGTDFEELLADPEALEQVLLYHITNGTLMSENLTNVSNVTTLQGSELPINVSDEGIFVGDAKVIQTNLTADNGVIYVIDAVLVPPIVEELYNDTVNLTIGNFTFIPANSTQSYNVSNLTDFGALYATGLDFNVSVQNATGNVSDNFSNVSFTLEGIEGIENNNTTGEMWFTYINGEPAEENFGLNNVSDEDKISFWYTTEEDGAAAIENATYVANVSVSVEGIKPGNNLTVLYNDTVNLTAGNVVFMPGTKNYTIDNLTDFGALYAADLNFTAALAQNMTGNVTNMTNVSFVLKNIEGVENNNTTGEKWFIYINDEPAEENLGLNPVSNGDRLSFWYTTEEEGAAAIENATYVANISVSVEGIEPEPGKNLTVLYNDTVNLIEGYTTFVPDYSTQSYRINNFTDFGALNATGLDFNASALLNGTGNMTGVPLILQSIEDVKNNDTTGEMWFIYINEEPAEDYLGRNNVSTGDRLSFWYTSEKGGDAAIENATYVANVTVGDLISKTNVILTSQDQTT
jgi:uncharacterized surface protein with fasciclin (FAS1) repeats/Flp pilus assembly pilin Flp